MTILLFSWSMLRTLPLSMMPKNGPILKLSFFTRSSGNLNSK